MTRVVTAFLTAVCLSIGFTLAARAQDLSSVVGILATFDLVLSGIVPADDPLEDPATSDVSTTSHILTTEEHSHLPKGTKYKLFGTAKDDLDPENGFNELISFDTTNPATVAGAFRKLGKHAKIHMFDNQVELRYLFVGRSCGGGSPRIQFGIDGDGDGKFNQFPGGPDQNAFGYIGDKPFGGGQKPDIWTYEDMTNAVAKWDLSQFGGSMTTPWDTMETFFNTLFPNHRVLNAVLVDDSHGFVITNQGCGYFDLVSTGKRTLTDHTDTTHGGTDPNNC
jgi:hypothetical protein